MTGNCNISQAQIVPKYRCGVYLSESFQSASNNPARQRFLSAAC